VAVPPLGYLGATPEVDEELHWYFAAEDGDYAAPSNFGRMLSPLTEDGEWRCADDHVAAVARFRRLRARLRSLRDRDAGILQCAYEPRHWPVRLSKAMGRLTGVVVRLSCDRATWPEARGEQLAVDAANAERLAAMLLEGSAADQAMLRDLKREAQAIFATAIASYTRARHGSLPARRRS
jgi:hypothetical protein